MKKRFLLIFLILSLIIAIGCENEETRDNPNQIVNDKENLEDVEEIEDEIGIKPYILSDENKDLLRILGLEREANIFTFKAPKAVNNIKANIYILDEDNSWKEIDKLSKVVEDKHFYNKDTLEGTFSIIIEGLHTRQMVIKLGQSISALRRDEDDYSIDREISEEVYVRASEFLEDFKNIEINKEIPIAIVVENEGEEIIPYNINSFYDTDNLKEFEYVQAVTLIFEDE